MHYIRLLSPIRLMPTHPPTLQAKLNITTDLSDALLCPDAPVQLVLTLTPSSPSSKLARPISLTNDTLQWKPGARVLKMAVPTPRSLAFFPKDVIASIHVHASGGDEHASAPKPTPKPTLRPTQAGSLVTIMGVHAALNVRTQLRHLPVCDGERLVIEEQMGESITLHIWDGAPAMFSRMKLFRPALALASAVPMPLLEDLIVGKPAKPSGGGGVRVLELGCGVGVLGLGLAHVLTNLASQDPGRRQDAILMTDLPVAEETVRLNIARREALLPPAKAARAPSLSYQNLDWGAVAAASSKGSSSALGLPGGPWDLVMLSDCTYNDGQFDNLVATLGAIHRACNGATTTRVLLGTKPRHESEDTFFAMILKEGWEVMESAVVPVDGAVGDHGEEQAVRLFLYEKVGGGVADKGGLEGSGRGGNGDLRQKPGDALEVSLAGLAIS